MNLDEAVEINKAMKESIPITLFDNRKAIQLGIEALTRELILRHWQRANHYSVSLGNLFTDE